MLNTGAADYGAVAADLPPAPAVKKPGPDGASEGQWEHFAAVGLVILTYVIGLIVTMDWSEAELLTMEADEASAIAPPLARILTSSEINRRAGAKIVASEDWLMVAMASVSYVQRVGPAISARFSDKKVVSDVPSRQAATASAPGAGRGQPGADPNYIPYPAHLIAS